jgi:hypothetical protein
VKADEKVRVDWQAYREIRRTLERLGEEDFDKLVTDLGDVKSACLAIVEGIRKIQGAGRDRRLNRQGVRMAFDVVYGELLHVRTGHLASLLRALEERDLF